MTRSTWGRAARALAPGVLVVLGMLTLGGLASAQERVTVESLLREMVDMQRLATAPEPGVECDQQSSYDRASTKPDAPNWFANGDAGQFLRVEERNGAQEWVMSEMTGPGAIVRLWSANPDGGGTVRVYIDDMGTPALEQDFLALTSAQLPEFPEPFSGRRSLGANLYFPMPYQTKCKVTVSKPGLYHHVGYRTLPAGTQVEPFSMAVLPRVKATMDEVGALLSDPVIRLAATKGCRREGTTVVLGPREAAHWVLSGPAAVTRFEARPLMDKETLTDTLKESILMVRWDGEEKPSVWAPLGDFFGSTPGINPYSSLPVGMTQDGLMYSNWFMPFEKQAEVVIRNDSKATLTLQVAAWLKPIDWEAKPWIHFHAKWWNEWLPADPTFVDWPLLECDGGPGRFVGTMLGIMNTHQSWWGEGDEKFWVDNDTFPSYFGTGSEDYFGYAWCNTALFTHAYHNQSICTGPANFGYTAVARYHIIDDIPFRHRLRMYIEKWNTADREYCSTSYWYGPLGGTDMYRRPPEIVRGVLPLPEPFHVEGALEGEKLEILTVTGGTTEVQGLSGEFSHAEHLWWRNPKEGDTLELKLPVDKAGRYQLILGLTKSWDYGIHQFLLDEKPMGDPQDLIADQVAPFRLDLGAVDLTKGDHVLTIKCMGTNPNARPHNFMCGLDYVLLKPAG